MLDDDISRDGGVGEYFADDVRIDLGDLVTSLKNNSKSSCRLKPTSADLILLGIYGHRIPIRATITCNTDPTYGPYDAITVYRP